MIVFCALVRLRIFLEQDTLPRILFSCLICWDTWMVRCENESYKVAESISVYFSPVTVNITAGNTIKNHISGVKLFVRGFAQVFFSSIINTVPLALFKPFSNKFVVAKRRLAKQFVRIIIYVLSSRFWINTTITWFLTTPPLNFPLQLAIEISKRHANSPFPEPLLSTRIARCTQYQYNVVSFAVKMYKLRQTSSPGWSTARK